MNYKTINIVFSIFILCLSFLIDDAFSQSATRKEVFAGEYIIQKKPTSLPTSTTGTQDTFQEISRTNFVQLVTPKSKGSSLQSVTPSSTRVDYNPIEASIDCQEILKDPSIESCEPNFVQYLGAFPNDPYFANNYPYQLCLYSPFTNGTSMIDVGAAIGLNSTPGGWDYSTGSPNVVIGILDSGIDYNHADLIANVWRNPVDTTVNGIDEDQNGYVDDILGIDANARTNNPIDCNGHGSHVAGIIGARGNNGIGIAGVAWNVKLAMARTAPDCGPSISTLAVIRGLEYFYDLKLNRGVNIVAINGSYGGSNPTQAEFNAIRRLANVNIVFVAAAGNDGVNIDFDPRYPAAYGLSNIITVGNIDTNTSNPNRLNTGSNYGVSRVDLGAPGTDIYSTVQPDPFWGPNQYDSKTGTSMAAPMVTGAVALLAAQRPLYKSVRLLKEGIVNYTLPMATLSGKVRTGGTMYLPRILSAPNAPDLCPSDPQKLDPGVCGCGVADNSPDSDADFVPNCVDLCPVDPGKSSAGICGCGVADTDSDADGTPDCNDQCPFLAAKTAPGICGCGFADVDANRNGKLDCYDASISSVKPKAPKVAVDRKQRSKLLVTMTARKDKGLSYLVTITTTTTTKLKNGKKKVTTKVKMVKSSKASVLIGKPGKGVVLKVSYQYVYQGPTLYASAMSPVKQLKF